MSLVLDRAISGISEKISNYLFNSNRVDYDALLQPYNFYSNDDRKKILSFLENNKLIIEVLQEAPDEIKKVFSSVEYLYLDPSFKENGSVEDISIRIGARLPSKEGFRKELDLNKNWWQRKSAKINKDQIKLLITFDSI